MPKSIKELKDFSGGLNTKHDSKDIKDNEFTEAKGVMFDKPGKIRLSRRSEAATDGTTTIPNWNPSSTNLLNNGYGLGFINTDAPIQKIRIEVPNGHSTPVTVPNMVGKYLSVRSSAGEDSWNITAGGQTFSVLRVVEVNSSSTPNYLYCSIIAPGAAPNYIFGQDAYTYAIYLADDVTGNNSTTTGLTFQNGSGVTGLSSETLTNPSFDGSAWAINAGSGATPWTLTTGSGGSMAFDASDTGAAGVPAIFNWFYQNEASNAVTWTTDTSYVVKIVLSDNNNPFASSTPYMWFSLLGGMVSIRNSDFYTNGDTVKECQVLLVSGSSTGTENIDGFRVGVVGGYTSDTSGDFTITEMSVKKHGWNNDEELIGITTVGEANLISVNATDNTLDRYSFQNGTWSTFNNNENGSSDQATIKSLSIDSSGNGTFSTTSDAKISTYVIDGAMHFIDTNFSAGHKSSIAANYWAGRINKKLFGDSGFRYQGWIFTLMDIHPPYKGKLHKVPVDNTAEGEALDMDEGYLSMMVRPARSDANANIWESGADPDGWWAGRSSNQNASAKWNRGCSFQKSLIETATNSTSPDNFVGGYCVSREFFHQSANGSNALTAIYRSDWDYRGATNAVNPPIDTTLDANKNINFDLYLSVDLINKWHSQVSYIEVYFGDHMTVDADWGTSAAFTGYRYEIPKSELHMGWNKVKIDVDEWSGVIGNPDKTSFKNFAVAIHLNDQTQDHGGHNFPTVDGTAHGVASATTAGSGAEASAVNHHQPIVMDSDVAGSGFSVGDTVYCDKAGDSSIDPDSSTTSTGDNMDELVTITSISGTSMYVTRGYLKNELWAMGDHGSSYSAIATTDYQIGHGGTYPGQQSADYQLDGAMNVHKISTIEEPAFIVSNISKGEHVPGDWDGEYKFYYSWVYDGKQESKLYEFPETATFNSQGAYFNFFLKEGVGGGFGLASELGLPGHRIDKANVYYSKITEGNHLHDRRYYLLGELDLDLGFRFADDEKYTSWKDDYFYSGVKSFGSVPSTQSRTDFLRKTLPVVDVFESKSGYSNDTISINSHFKDLAFNNGIAYIAYPYQATNILTATSSSERKTFPDRILKSIANKYDIFPSDNFIDVVIDDGESIVALETFNDRLLEFKQNTLYVINISGELEYLEDSFSHLGVQTKLAVTKSDVGVIFANRNGIYLYGGENAEPINLLGKLNETDWASFAGKGDELVSIYVPSMDQVMVAKTSSGDSKSDTYIVDLQTLTVSKTTDGLDLSGQYGYSNPVLDTVNGQPLWLSDDNSAEKVYTIDNFDDSTATSGGHASGGVDIKTKFLDFDAPGVKKKIYKVRISYKCAATSNVTVKFDTNQATAYDKTFANGTNFTSNELASTSSAWATAELKPTTSSQANNIYSFGLRIYSDGVVPEDFQINDISIIYRYKNVS